MKIFTSLASLLLIISFRSYSNRADFSNYDGKLNTNKIEKAFVKSKHKFEGAKVISLTGIWKFKLDPSNEGKDRKWYSKDLDETISLPGTTDQAQKGNKVTTPQAGRLTRVYSYYGLAWYQQTVTIPNDWKGKHITFLMERTKTTTVWVDDTPVGSQNTLAGKQIYDLTSFLTPGKHRISVVINNRDNPPVGDPHQISDNTQTNWNGIIGKIELRATDAVWMDDVELYPNVSKHYVAVKIKFGKITNVPVTGTVSITASSWNVAKSQRLKAASFPCKVDTAGFCTIIYNTGANVQLWDEFSPAIYKFKINFSGKYKNGTYTDNKEINTGLRDFKTKGTQFSINGKTIFIRGKHDACVFPLTGYPPMTLDGWVKVLRIAKSYGINTYRFHSWCPPEAAFEAADIVGMYMQPELPIWGSIGRPAEIRVGDVEQHIDNDPVELRTKYLLAEGRRILNDFGNYSSFVMFALGNELTGSKAVMASMVKGYRDYDNRHLYAQGANNFLNNPELPPGDDYWVTTMTGGHYTAGNYRIDTRGKDVRSSYPVDTIGHINNYFAGTTYNYSESIKGIPVPVIGHEIGQFQTYPNYNEIKKYTGVVQARNFEIFKKRLEAAGMGDQADEFFKASGALAVLCYREEIETALRTPGFGGFHLLDLQDFPGQGTALVGILDAFMDSKGLITPAKWREFCNATVPLVKMKSYIWTNSEIFVADAEIANYGPSAFNASSRWTLTDELGHQVAAGKLLPKIVSQGGITQIGKIQADLSKVASAQKLTLTLNVANYTTTYPIWVYPSTTGPVDLTGVVVSNELDNNTINTLNSGGKVLLFVDAKTVKKTVPGAFQTDFWSYTMFKKYNPPGTMGILCNPQHPVFNEFPTDFSTNWQWWRLLRKSPAMVLDDMPQGFKPIVQVVDNLERNHKLGLLFETHVGKGSLIVCSINLPSLQQYSEARSLLQSMAKYMKSSDFNPKLSIDASTLFKVLNTDVK